MEQATFEYPAALYGGMPPHAQGVETSRAAAESVQESANVWRARVRGLIAAAGARGMTADEVASRLGVVHNTSSPRVRELFLLGEIANSGQTRPTRAGRQAIVWVIA